MRIAITGATGFIGRYMVRGMLGAGHAVTALCRPGREDALDLPEEAAAVGGSVEGVLAEGYRTRDIAADGGDVVGTSRMGDVVAGAV